MDFNLDRAVRDVEFREAFYKKNSKRRENFLKYKIKRKNREKGKNTKSITNAFNQKWLKEHNKEE